MYKDQNFKKKPHTARWLMTFHTAGAGLPAEIEEEREALEFITATPAPAAESRPANRFGTTEIFIKGWRILTGPGLVTEKQAAWMIDIAETREGVTDEMVRSLAERLAQGFNRQAGSDFLTRYKDLPRKAEPVAAPVPDALAKPVADVPAGRYAIVVDGVTKFYRVSKGKGQWLGRTFVNAQASDDQYPIRNPKHRAEILAAIAEDLHAAEIRYADELGRCYRCGRTLTDEASREARMGPDCRAK